MPVIIEFSRCIDTYSSAKFEYINYSTIFHTVLQLKPAVFMAFFIDAGRYAKGYPYMLHKQNKLPLNRQFILVDLAGIEPASENPFIKASSITVIYLTFPLSAAK